MVDLENNTTTQSKKKEIGILIFSIFVAGLCSIVYELEISTISSYFHGDDVTHFSVTIGVYMAAMGLGALISRKINTNLLKNFIIVEIVLGFIGGISVPLLYFAFSTTESYYIIMLLMIVAIGILTGLEVPLLTRIMEEYYPLKSNLSNVLSIDYLGALIATLIFPFLLIPFVGTFRSSLVIGILNMSIGFLNLVYFSKKLKLQKSNTYLVWSIVVTLFLGTLLLFSQNILKHWQDTMYEDRVVYSKESKYQKIVVTKGKDDLKLFLNQNLQFSSIDEYRYHEALVHIPFSKAKAHKNVLMLGGGDGLAAREMLKYHGLKDVTIVDIDPEVNKLCIKNPHIAKLNLGSLQNEKITVLHKDAFKYIEKSNKLYDVIIVDLPDPNNNSLARLYSREFYKLCQRRLADGGVFITQATSSFYSTESFWCINRTVKAGGFPHTFPFHAYVPSFGDWGFIMASNTPISTTDFSIAPTTKFLTNQIAEKLFFFEKDLLVKSNDYSSLDSPKILAYYLDSWHAMN